MEPALGRASDAGPEYLPHRAAAAEREAASVNFRIRCTNRPGSDLFIISNVGTRFASLAAENPERLREQWFAVKPTYSFSL